MIRADQLDDAARLLDERTDMVAAAVAALGPAATVREVREAFMQAARADLSSIVEQRFTPEG